MTTAIILHLLVEASALTWLGQMGSLLQARMLVSTTLIQTYACGLNQPSTTSGHFLEIEKQ